MQLSVRGENAMHVHASDVCVCGTEPTLMRLKDDIGAAREQTEELARVFEAYIIKGNSWIAQ